MEEREKKQQQHKYCKIMIIIKLFCRLYMNKVNAQTIIVFEKYQKQNHEKKNV